MSIVGACSRDTPSTAGPSRSVASRMLPVERLVEAAQQPRAPVRADNGERAEQRIGAPMRHPGHDQVTRRGDAGDRLAMRDMVGDQGARQGAHPDLVAAVADRDRIPRPGREQLVERARYRR